MVNILDTVGYRKGQLPRRSVGRLPSPVSRQFFGHLTVNLFDYFVELFTANYLKMSRVPW